MLHCPTGWRWPPRYHGISLTHAFGLPLPWAVRASEKTLMQTRRVCRAHLRGRWPARVGLSSPELSASCWGHICYTTATGRPFFLIKISNFTTQNGLGLLPQIQWMTRKAGFPILKCCLSQKISNKGSPSLKIRISYSPRNQLFRLPIFTTFFLMLRMTKQLPRSVRKLTIFSSLASTRLQMKGMRNSYF